jgi:DNA-directed RNA polymerase subunit H
MAEKEKSFDIFKHELVPPHRILTAEEKKALFARYGITARHLPRIRESDPAVKALGAKPGDVLEILRKSPTAGVAKYYRVVIKKK